jgi:RNA polymerase sigma-70 factor (ECF subfamily)
MWPDPIETQAMLEDAAGDDRSAVDRLLALYREPLRRMIAVRMDRSLGRREDASDVVQGVLLEASRRLGEYLRRPPMPFPLWLRQIARDQLIDVHRRHRMAACRSIGRERPLTVHEFSDRSSLDLASALFDQGPTPAALAIRRELADRFAAALEKLCEDDREILVMRHFEHLTNSETAAGLGLSEPAAGMRYLRALRRLRAVLAIQPEEEMRT